MEKYFVEARNERCIPAYAERETMAVCDKKYSSRISDPAGRVAGLEAHVIYLQERLEFYASKNDKKIRELEAEVAELKKQIKTEEIGYGKNR